MHLGRAPIAVRFLPSQRKHRETAKVLASHECEPDPVSLRLSTKAAIPSPDRVRISEISHHLIRVARGNRRRQSFYRATAFPDRRYASNLQLPSSSSRLLSLTSTSQCGFGVLGQSSKNLCPNFRSKPANFLSIIDRPTTCGHLAEQDHGLRHRPAHARGRSTVQQFHSCHGYRGVVPVVQLGAEEHYVNTCPWLAKD